MMPDDLQAQQLLGNNAPRSDIPDLTAPNRYHEVIAVLKSMNVPQELAQSLVTDFGQETDVKRFPFEMVRYSETGVPLGLVDGKWREKILWLADAMTLSIVPSDPLFAHKNVFVTAWER